MGRLGLIMPAMWTAIGSLGLIMPLRRAMTLTVM